MKRLLLYLLRWQASTPILAVVTYYLASYDAVVSAVIANLIGGLLFYKIDKTIFKGNHEREK